ncbi:MAG: aldehyde dehydrogenase family protein [Myxococcota bacterium]|nr:aldehyde dehydrogenase family protein [Myxococcota bacterium]
MGLLTSFNPANGEPVGQVPMATTDDVRRAVGKARKAQAHWASLGLEARRDLLLGAAARMGGAADELGAMITREMGKPIREAIGEVKSCGATLAAELDEMVHALQPELIEDRFTRSTLLYDPLGVCAVITPWNFPFSMPHWMVLPALMAGNTVVLKPSEETPIAGQAYADILGHELPAGVLNVVHGADLVGRTLVSEAVDLIAFTGSRQVGKSILGAATPDLKRVILELGGKDPMVVLSDADVAKAARFAARNSFRNAGQICVSTERIYVPESVADPFVHALAQEAERMVLGDGLAPDTRIGPMVNARQRDHVMGQVREAIAQGATLVRGGDASSTGCFLSPVVLDGVTHEMRIAREETFGPVACIIRVADRDEAVRLANDTPYGLGATVFGRDVEQARQTAHQLSAGMVGINRGVGGAFGTPWVGARQSGYGYHKSIAGHRQFTQVRVISEVQPKEGG